MKFDPRSVILKNGQSVLIRQCGVGDAEHLMEMVRTYLKDSEYIPKLTSEFKLTLEQEKQWIQSFIDKDNSLLLVAEHNHTLIGNIDLTGHSRLVMQHTAMVGMGMLSEWRNTRLGTALLQAAVEWAKNNPCLEVLWLQVYTANTAGLALYRKIGFADNGIIPRFFKHEDRYYDNLTMSLSVK